jgi:hypothetical protein
MAGACHNASRRRSRGWTGATPPSGTAQPARQRFAAEKAMQRVWRRPVGDAYRTFSQIKVVKPILPSKGSGAGRVVVINVFPSRFTSRV